MQLRPGQWDLEVHALHPDYVTELTADSQPEPWPGQETWSFEAQPSLRLVEVEGAVQVDPRQTRLPPAWHSLPSYQMTPGTPLRLNVVRRGDPQPEPDRLQLQRDLWLDFDGQGFTLQDRITGRMTVCIQLMVRATYRLIGTAWWKASTLGASSPPTTCMKEMTTKATM